MFLLLLARPSIELSKWWVYLLNPVTVGGGYSGYLRIRLYTDVAVRYRESIVILPGVGSDAKSIIVVILSTESVVMLIISVRTRR